MSGGGPVTAIVAAAGRGRRFGAGENKVFAPLGGVPILVRTLRVLSACPDIRHLVIVTAAEDLERVEVLASGFDRLHSVCVGGAERSDSVRAALARVPGDTPWVAVHDAARPLVSPALVTAVIQAAWEAGAAVPATPVSDTLKRAGRGDYVDATVDRAGLWAVQTPQVARLADLREAYRRAAEEGFAGTDDASYLERIGVPVRLVPGERSNLKITLAEDVRMAEGWLHTGECRTGFGYDVHRLVPGRRLVLGGVEVPHPDGLGLDGHSDADVLLHAVSDALLGAAALGDIGRHFPNTDERYRGADSLELLRQVRALLAETGWAPVNVDSMVLAERPRIGPHVDAMRERIAGALGVPVDAVSVKATTNERLGFEGREEGIAAHAVATIRRT